MLGHDEVCFARAGRLPFVEILTVQQQNHVRILFERAGFAKVGEHRTLVLPLLRTTVQLADRDNGNIEFLCQQFERA